MVVVTVGVGVGAGGVTVSVGMTTCSSCSCGMNTASSGGLRAYTMRVRHWSIRGASLVWIAGILYATIENRHTTETMIRAAIIDRRIKV